MDFNIALERLQKYCPLDKPFEIVKIIRKHNELGWFIHDKDGFKIGIAFDINVTMQIDTLIHEWAHGLRGPEGLHDDLFGIEWARCYRAVWAEEV